jgi:hypothetical protein
MRMNARSCGWVLGIAGSIGAAAFAADGEIAVDKRLDVSPAPLADPRMIYLPRYDPAHTWGPSLYYAHASWYYRTAAGGGHSDFPIGERLWGGSDWQPGHGIIGNNFINGYNFNPILSGLRGRYEWSLGAWNHRSPLAWIGLQTTQEMAPTFAAGSTFDGGYQPAATEVLIWIRFR